MNIRTLVDVEIEERLEQMSKLEPESEAYKANNDAVLKLMDRSLKMEELDIRSKENEVKLAQIIEDRKAKKIDSWLRLAGIVVPAGVAFTGGLIFSVIERTEVNASTPTKEFLKRLLRLS